MQVCVCVSQDLLDSWDTLGSVASDGKITFVTFDIPINH